VEAQLFVVTDRGSAAPAEIHRAHTDRLDGVEAEAGGIDRAVLHAELAEPVRRRQADRGAASP
jgi:hypothetical protein